MVYHRSMTYKSSTMSTMSSTKSPIKLTKKSKSPKSHITNHFFDSEIQCCSNNDLNMPKKNKTHNKKQKHSNQITNKNTITNQITNTNNNTNNNTLYNIENFLHCYERQKSPIYIKKQEWDFICYSDIRRFELTSLSYEFLLLLDGRTNNIQCKQCLQILTINQWPYHFCENEQHFCEPQIVWNWIYQMEWKQCSNCGIWLKQNNIIMHHDYEFKKNSQQITWSCLFAKPSFLNNENNKTNIVTKKNKIDDEYTITYYDVMSQKLQSQKVSLHQLITLDGKNINDCASIVEVYSHKDGFWISYNHINYLIALSSNDNIMVFNESDIEKDAKKDIIQLLFTMKTKELLDFEMNPNINTDTKINIKPQINTNTQINIINLGEIQFCKQDQQLICIYKQNTFLNNRDETNNKTNNRNNENNENKNNEKKNIVCFVCGERFIEWTLDYQDGTQELVYWKVKKEDNIWYHCSCLQFLH